MGSVTWKFEALMALRHVLAGLSFYEAPFFLIQVLNEALSGNW